MSISINKKLVPVEKLQTIHDIQLPIGLKFRQLIVTGPPGSGKSHLIRLLHGWPNEGYIDLTRRDWWRDQTLTYRPREVHLGMPFVGFSEALTVFDKEWLEKPTAPTLDTSRFVIPPTGEGLFQTDWLGRYIFEFLLPPPEKILEFRERRKADSYHPVDEDVTLEIIHRQVATYAEVAQFMQRRNFQVYVREAFDQPPMRIAEEHEFRPPDWAVKSPEPLLRFDGMTTIIKTILGNDDIDWLEPGDEPQELIGESRVAYDGYPLELNLGGMGLKFVPEVPFGARLKRIQKNWIVYDPKDAAKGPYPSIRIKEGENVVVGRANDEYDAVFNFSKNVARSHIKITNENGDLIFTVLDEDRETLLSKLPKEEREIVISSLPWKARVRDIYTERLSSLKKVREYFGGTIELLPSDLALAQIKSINELLLNEPCREKDARGEAGALIDLPENLATVIVGDLHAQIDNLLKVLIENHFLSCLEQGTANLLILGDAIHSEIDGQLEEMDTSILMLDLIFCLKQRFPGNFFYLRGNHDSFDPEVSKNGVPQGVLLRRRLLELRGEEYVREMECFFERLAYIARAEAFIACHAGPPSREMKYDEIVNLRNHPKRTHEVMTSRLKRPNKPGGYSKGDVKRFRKSLGAIKRTPLIVGHTPLSPHGSVWINVGDIKDHHVLYSGNPQGPGIFLNVGKRLVPFEYPTEPLLALVNNLD